MYVCMRVALPNKPALQSIIRLPNALLGRQRRPLRLGGQRRRQRQRLPPSHELVGSVAEDELGGGGDDAAVAVAARVGDDERVGPELENFTKVPT